MAYFDARTEVGGGVRKEKEIREESGEGTMCCKDRGKKRERGQNRDGEESAE